MRFEPGTGKLWCANGEKEGCCATVPAPGGSHLSRILLCPQGWGSSPGLLSLAICEGQIAACSSPAALGLEVLDLQQSSVMGASTHGPGGLRSGRGGWRGAGWELVGRYEKDKESLWCRLCGCEVLPSPALCSVGSFPAAVVKFCDYYYY